MNLKKIGKVFTSKFVGTGPSSYKKRIYRAAVSRRLRNTALSHILRYFKLSLKIIIFQNKYGLVVFTKLMCVIQLTWVTGGDSAMYTDRR